MFKTTLIVQNTISKTEALFIELVKHSLNPRIMGFSIYFLRNPIKNQLYLTQT